MPAERDRQSRRIRQLLELAEHPDTPSEEKEAAFARAGALMQKYEIEEEEVRRSSGQDAEAIVVERFAVSGKGGHGRERAWALGRVAEGMGCAIAYTANDTSNRVRWIQIVGPQSTIDNLKILLPTVLLQMENAAAKATRDRVRELPAWLSNSERARESAIIRRSFMRGFGRGIEHRLKAATAEYQQELHDQAVAGNATSNSRELVLLDREAKIEAEFRNQFPRLRKARSPKYTDARSYRQGFDAGEQSGVGQGELDHPGD